MPRLNTQLRSRLLELADGTRTTDEVAALTKCSPGQVRVLLHRMRKEGHELPMKRRPGSGHLPLPEQCERDYEFIAGRLLEGWTMTQIAKYMKRDVEQLENYWKLLTGKLMMIEIEKGIEIPGKRSGQPPKYPVYTMEIGDSFKFSIDDHYGVRGAIRRARPKKFTTRKIDDGHMRCWRVE